jgi:hypothetical protein
MPYPRFSSDATVVVVLASEGYPDAPVTGPGDHRAGCASDVPG